MDTSAFFHFINDLVLAFGYILTNLKDLVILLLSPIISIGLFLGRFFIAVFSPAVTPNNAITTNAIYVNNFFNSIPFWSYVVIGVDTLLLILVSWRIIRSLQDLN